MCSSDLADHPLLQPVVPVAARHKARIQGLVPDPVLGAADPGVGRAIVYRRPEGPFARYVRYERLVAHDRLADDVAALLEASADAARPGGAPGLDGGHGPHTESNSGRELDGGREPDTESNSGRGLDGGHESSTASEPDGGARTVADVLVCTHGSRDVCCGGDGMRVHRELTALAARDLPGVRVWRTSHTGGHRFAPTAVTFPDGRAWASLSAELLAGIVTRTVSVGEAARHDRGGAAFADPFAQAADGAVLAAEGWSWLDTARTVDVQPVDGDDTRRLVTVTAAGSGNGEAGNGGSAPGVAYRAEVAVRRIVPVPDCGRPLDQARKSAPELEVLTLTRL